MNAYIYRAALYCESCATKIAADCKHPSKVEPVLTSDEYPDGPYSNGGGEADCPQHCDSCHVFLENPLTDEGYDYVCEQAELILSLSQTPRVNQAVIRQWFNFYDLKVVY